jgi:hypothetical protein
MVRGLIDPHTKPPPRSATSCSLMIENAKLDRALTKVNCQIATIARLRDAGAISERMAERELKQAIAFRAELMRQIDGQEFAFEG